MNFFWSETRRETNSLSLSLSLSSHINLPSLKQVNLNSVSDRTKMWTDVKFDNWQYQLTLSRLCLKCLSFCKRIEIYIKFNHTITSSSTKRRQKDSWFQKALYLLILWFLKNILNNDNTPYAYLVSFIENISLNL